MLYPTIAPTGRRVSVTIPGSGSAAASLESLAVAALNAIGAGEGDALRPYIIGGKVWEAPAAYTAGDSTTSLPVAVAASTAYDEPMADFLKRTFVKAAGAGTIVVTVSVYLLTKPTPTNA